MAESTHLDQPTIAAEPAAPTTSLAELAASVERSLAALRQGFGGHRAAAE